MSKPKRSKEWLLAKEIHEVGMVVRYPIKERKPEVSYGFETLKDRLPRAHTAMIAVARHILKNFTRKK